MSSIASNGQRDALTSIEITRVAAYQPDGCATPRSFAVPGGKFTATLSSGEPIAFEVTLRLDGRGARERAISLSGFEVEIYAYNRSTSAGKHLEAVDRGCVDATSRSFATRLPADRLPSGTYRLELSAALADDATARSCVQIPYLRIA